MANSNIKFTKQHHVETARFEFFMLKQTLLDLFDELRGNKSHIGADLQQDGEPPEGCDFNRILPKITDAEGKLERFEQQMESMADSLCQMITKSRTDKKAQTAKAKQREELAKSLKELELAYTMNRQRLTRDLNKMEQQINNIKDARERIEIKHLKFSDIAQREFDKIMPNDLTQSIKLKQRGKAASEKVNS